MEENLTKLCSAQAISSGLCSQMFKSVANVTNGKEFYDLEI
jgi:hypothetical protein